MDSDTKKKNKIIWLLVLILLICVAATTICVVNRLNDYLKTDEGAIELVPQSEEEAPAFQISDDGKVWGAETEIEIFRISYENGEKEITVNSERGDNVIAPGTDSTYTFKLKNTGNVPLDFSVEMDSYFEPEGMAAKLQGRLLRYDGKWVVGDDENYGELEQLNGASDVTSLGVGRYAYYTFEWQWPFEDGNDELDTYLGSEAVKSDIVFKVKIKTSATVSADKDCQTGLLPATGDNSDIILWVVVGLCALLAIIFLARKKDEEE